MAEPVLVRVIGDIAIVTIDNPPANALTQPVREGLMTALAGAARDDRVRALILAARGKTFPSATDVPRAGGSAGEPTLARVCNAVETLAKPVIAALQGKVMGGGLELAMAAHYRFADPRASFGFPDIAIGLLPGAGGTQRLPRLIGIGPALDMLQSGGRITAEQAQKAGLIDLLADEALPKFTLARTREMMAKGLGPRPTRERDTRLKGGPGMDIVAKRRAALKPGPLPAQGKVLDSIEATLLLPFEAGLAMEKAIHEDLIASPESRALRHMVRAERQTLIPPIDTPATPRRIADVGIVGASPAAIGLVVACLDAGLSVTWVEPELEVLEAGVEAVIDVLERDVGRGRLDAKSRDARIARMTGKTEMSALAAADLVIEAVPDQPEAKRRVFGALDAVLKRDAVIASTASWTDLDGLAAGTGRPESIIGFHVFVPAQINRLVEVVVGVDTADDVIATAYALAVRLRKLPVAVGVGTGYVANRVYGALLRTAEALAIDGADPARVDQAMHEFGFAMGPFQYADVMGLNSAADLLKRLSQGQGAAAGTGALFSGLARQGRLGHRTGKGIFAYQAGSTAGVSDPEVAQTIIDLRAAMGRTTKTPDTEEVQRRCLAAMANEGAMVLEESVAARPADVDVAMVTGFGFPRWRGGPMKAADIVGLLRVKRDLDGYAAEEPDRWRVAPTFAELVKNGASFDDLNRV